MCKLLEILKKDDLSNISNYIMNAGDKEIEIFGRNMDEDFIKNDNTAEYLFKIRTLSKVAYVNSMEIRRQVKKLNLSCNGRKDAPKELLGYGEVDFHIALMKLDENRINKMAPLYKSHIMYIRNSTKEVGKDINGIKRYIENVKERVGDLKCLKC